MAQIMLPKFIKITEGRKEEGSISETGCDMWDNLNNEVLANIWSREAFIYSCKEDKYYY